MHRQPAPPQMFLVVDDLALELPAHPIYVPVPPALLKGRDSDAALRRFTMEVLRDLMRLKYYTWYHSLKDVVVDGFTVRHSNIYPSFST